MAYEYRVTRDYMFHGEQLHEGDIVTDADFHEPDMPANLIGRGVLEPADAEAEEARLVVFEVFDQDDNRVDRDGNILVARIEDVPADPEAEPIEDEQ